MIGASLLLFWCQRWKKWLYRTNKCNSNTTGTNQGDDTVTTNPAILVFAGSARRESLNKKLARTAADSARTTGAEVTLLDLRDYPIPLYDGDLEAESGVPENARALRRLMAIHHGLIVVSPEYNGFITPLLKNTLDWISRPDGAEDGLTLYRDKVALVLSASPGALGGLRSLQLIRQ